MTCLSVLHWFEFEAAEDLLAPPWLTYELLAPLWFAYKFVVPLWFVLPLLFAYELVVPLLAENCAGVVASIVVTERVAGGSC